MIMSMDVLTAVQSHPLLSTLGVRYHAPEAGRPLVLMLPGLACTADHFTDPLNARLTGDSGNSIPFDWLLTTLQPPSNGAYWPFFDSHRLSLCPPLKSTGRKVESIFDRVVRTGCGAITWSPRKPSGPIAHTVEEAATLCDLILAEEFAGARLVFLGHSRGGLLARRLLAVRADLRHRASALIMLSCPNHGSRLATLMDRLKWFSGEVLAHTVAFTSGLSGEERTSLARFLRNYLFFVARGALQEIRHDSKLFQEYRQMEKHERTWGVPYYHLYGTSPRYNRLYIKVGDDYRTVLEMWDGLPWLVSPDELKMGKGDGLVAWEHALLGWEAGVWGYEANHGELLVDRGVQDRIAGLLGAL